MVSAPRIILSSFSHFFFSSISRAAFSAFLKASSFTNSSGSNCSLYSIQGRFGQYIEGIIGDYYNVVGFPLSRFYREMKQTGLLDNLMISC